jgi:NTP pyrophosphatase (non-canonical NTP hydrolase)
MTGFREVQQTALEDSQRWFPGKANDLVMMTLGICGESGEFADIVKKICRGSQTVEGALEDMRDELTDVFIYIIQTAELLNFDILDRYMAHHRPANELRFQSRDNGND